MPCLLRPPMSKYRISRWNACAALFACLVLLAGGCERGQKYSPLPPGSAVLAFGDSVTFGTGAGSGEDYPSRLAAISGWVVHNKGVPGDTTAGAAARLAQALDETQPKLVIVEIGGNDFLRQVGEAEVKQNIRGMLQAAKQAGVPAVLVAVPRFSLLGAALGALPDARLYAELAQEENVPLVAKVFADVLSDPALKADQIHPNAAGYRQLAEGIAASLRKSGLLGRH